MKAKSCFSVVALIAVVFFVSTANAVDIGDPIFKSDVSGIARLEVLYEKYDRKAEIKIGSCKISRPGGTVTVAGDTITSKADINLFLARLNFLASDTLTLYIDGGGIDDEDADSTPLILGAGVNLLAVNKENFRFSGFVAAHYVPSYDASEDDFDADLGRIEAKGEATWWEAGAGVTAAGVYDVEGNLKIIPYAGIMFSVFRGKLDLEIDYPEAGGKVNANADIEEDQPLIGFIGTSFLLNKKFSVRGEGRFIGDNSFSGAIALAF